MQRLDLGSVTSEPQGLGQASELLTDSVVCLRGRHIDVDTLK